MNQKNGQVEENDPLVPDDVKAMLVRQELQIWRNTLYQTQLRFRVHRSLAKFSDTGEILKGLESEMMRCEAAMDTLNQILGELETVHSGNEVGSGVGNGDLGG